MPFFRPTDHPSVVTFLTATVVTLVVVLAPQTTVVVEYGPIKTAPAYVRLRVRVNQDAANRFLRVSIDDPAVYFRESHEDLPGAKAAITRTFEFRDVPAGDYTASVYVDRGAEDPWRATAWFRVIDGAGP